MPTKAELIRKQIGISSDQVRDLNNQLIERFDTSHKGGKLVVDCTGENVTIRTSGCPMETGEALRMARWLIDMIGEKQ